MSVLLQLRSPRGSPDAGLQSGKPSAPKKLKLDMGDAAAPPSHRKGDANANSDVCAAALRGGRGRALRPWARAGWCWTSKSPASSVLWAPLLGL